MRTEHAVNGQAEHRGAVALACQRKHVPRARLGDHKLQEAALCAT